MTRIRLILAGLAAIIMVAAPASANRNADITLPFEVTNSGHLLIDITLNGDTESRAILDTGATYPLVGRQTGAMFGAGEDPDAGMVDVFGLGLEARYPVVGLADLRFGSLVFDHLDAAYNDGFRVSGADTVLPAAIIPHRTLDFDFSRSSLRAYDRRPERVIKGTMSRLPVTWINDLPFVEVSVNGQDGLALIDTGANNTLINSAFAHSAARSQGDFHQIELTGATGEAVAITVLSSRRFRIGSFQIRHFDVVVLDPGFLTALGLEDTPVMIMGLDVLRQFRLQVDREDDEVRLSQEPKLSVTGTTIRYN